MLWVTWIVLRKHNKMSRGLCIYLNDFYYKHPAGKAQTMYPLNTSHCFGVQRTEPPHGGEPPWDLLTGSTIQFKHTQQSTWCCVRAPRAFQEQPSLSLGLPWMVALDSYTQGRCDITIFSFMSLEVLSHEGVYRFVWQGDDSIICFTPSKHFWKSFWNRNRKAFKNTSFMEIVNL